MLWMVPLLGTSVRLCIVEQTPTHIEKLRRNQLITPVKTTTLKTINKTITQHQEFFQGKVRVK